MTELKRKNTEERILNFLKERPCLNVYCIEKESGVGETVLSKAKSGSRKLSESNIKQLLPTLKKYGYK